MCKRLPAATRLPLAGPYWRVYSVEPYDRNLLATALRCPYEAREPSAYFEDITATGKLLYAPVGSQAKCAMPAIVAGHVVALTLGHHGALITIGDETRRAAALGHSAGETVGARDSF